MGYKTKVCLQCNETFQPTNGRQRWCTKCKPQVRKEQIAADYLNHREERNVHSKNWQAENHDKVLEYERKCYMVHQEERARQTSERKRIHHEEWAILNARNHAKRRRLGHIPMNQPFANSEGHHINQTDVIYIPYSLHRSIPHNVWTAKNMDKINALAYEWLAKENENANGNGIVAK